MTHKAGEKDGFVQCHCRHGCPSARLPHAPAPLLLHGPLFPQLLLRETTSGFLPLVAVNDAT